MIKRIKPAPEPKTNRNLRLIAAEDLARVQGGASMVEYALLLARPPGQ